MEAPEMVLLGILALIAGVEIHGMLKARNELKHMSDDVSWWKNETNEWRNQVDDERTR
jgi:hypothetical protein